MIRSSALHLRNRWCNVTYELLEHKYISDIELMYTAFNEEYINDLDSNIRVAIVHVM